MLEYCKFSTKKQIILLGVFQVFSSLNKILDQVLLRCNVVCVVCVTGHTKSVTCFRRVVCLESPSRKPLLTLSLTFSNPRHHKNLIVSMTSF